MTNDAAIPNLEPEQSDGVADRPKSKRGGCLIVCVILSPVVYVLSFPLLMLAMSFCVRRGWMEAADTLAICGGIFYRPIEWLIRNSELFNSLFEWYLSLFGDSINI